nr:hypothetical protein [uncultured Comamonas sp.]
MIPSNEDVLSAFDSFGHSHVPKMALQMKLRDLGFDPTHVVNALNSALNENLLHESNGGSVFRGKAKEAILSEQWEVAIRVYGFHQVREQTLGHAMSDSANQALAMELERFIGIGGVAKTGRGPLGDIGPVLELSDGTSVPYTAGSKLVAGLAEALRAELSR